MERRESDVHQDSKFEHSEFPQTLEDLEEEFKQEAIDLARLRDQQEDEENYRHRQVFTPILLIYLCFASGLISQCLTVR